MAFPDARVVIGGGLGRRQPSEDNISALVMQGVATGSLALGDVVELNSVADAEDLDLDAAYDTTNKVLVYHHITRFFFRNPNGKLFLMLVSQSVTLTDICDKANAYLKKLLSASSVAGKVRQAAVALNPITSYTPTLTGGLDGDVLTALPKAQELATEEFGLFRPVMIIVEGRQFNGTASAATNLRALDYPNVAVCIAQDKNIADTVISSTTPYKYYAAVGDILGYISLAAVHENIGWVSKFPLTDITTGKFVNTALSSNVDVGTMEAHFGTLHDKGYIFAVARPGVSGYYFSSAPTCALITNDLAYIENTRTINKAARLIRQALVPELNSPVPLTEDGKIQPAKIGAFEAKGKQALVVNMLTQGEISQCRVYIDPDQTFITNGETLSVEFDIVPVGVARTITATVTLTASL